MKTTQTLKIDAPLSYPPSYYELGALQKLAAEFLSERDYFGFLWLFDSCNRFLPFWEIHEGMTDEEYWDILRQVWVSIEWVEPHKANWIRLLQSRSSTRHLLMTEAEHHAITTWPDEIKIFRGYRAGRGKNGLSWSLSEKTAEMFPQLRWRGENQPMVVSGYCYKQDVIAYITEREEEEIVILPQNVYRMKTRKLVIDTGQEPEPKEKRETDDEAYTAGTVSGHTWADCGATYSQLVALKIFENSGETSDYKMAKMVLGAGSNKPVEDRDIIKWLNQWDEEINGAKSRRPGFDQTSYFLGWRDGAVSYLLEVYPDLPKLIADPADLNKTPRELIEENLAA